MEIKILGTGCAGCKAMFAAAETAIKELGNGATLVKEEDIVEIMKFNVMSLPAIVVDGKVLSQGKRLSAEEIKKILKK